MAAISNLIKEFPKIVLGVAVVGILVAYSIGEALTASLRARVSLKRLWKEKLAARGHTAEEMLPVDGGFAAGPLKRWLLPGEFLPKLIITAWIILATHVVFEKIL